MEQAEILQSFFDAKIIAILKLFLKEEGKEYYLREVAKLAKVSPASTYRILKKLVDLKILRLTEIKTAKLYALESNKTVEFLKGILEVDVIEYFQARASSLQAIEEILLLAKDKAKANVLILGTGVDVTVVKGIILEIKEKYGFTINQMCLTREQYEQMSSMGLYPGTKKSIYRR